MGRDARKLSLASLEERVSRMEDRQAAIDGALTLIRYALPILVAVSAVIVAIAK